MMETNWGPRFDTINANKPCSRKTSLISMSAVAFAVVSFSSAV